MIGAIASAVGLTARWLLASLRALPGIAGPLLVSYGVWSLNPYVGYIVAGLILWAADVLRSLPARKLKEGQ